MFKDIKFRIKKRTKNIKEFLLSILKDLNTISFSAKRSYYLFRYFFMLWNTFFDFNHFINSTLYLSFWTIVNRQAYHHW